MSSPRTAIHGRPLGVEGHQIVHTTSERGSKHQRIIQRTELKSRGRRAALHPKNGVMFHEHEHALRTSPSPSPCAHESCRGCLPHRSDTDRGDETSRSLERSSSGHRANVVGTALKPEASHRPPDPSIMRRAIMRRPRDRDARRSRRAVPPRMRSRPSDACPPAEAPPPR